MPLLPKPGRVIATIGNEHPFMYGGGVIYDSPRGAELWWTNGAALDDPGTREDDAEAWVYRITLYDDRESFEGRYSWFVNWREVARYMGLSYADIFPTMETPTGRADLIVGAMVLYPPRWFDARPEPLRLGELGRRHW